MQSYMVLDPCLDIYIKSSCCVPQTCCNRSILFFLCVAGRRRSSRLIESPWVFNWPKKRPLFVNLEEDSLDKKMEILLKRSRQEVNDTTCSAHHTLRSSSKDVRSLGMHVSEDEDEFVTPGENFQSSGKKRAIPDGSPSYGLVLHLC